MANNNEPKLLEHDLLERLKTTKNRAEIGIILYNLGHQELLATILEDLFFGCQTILDHYAVKDKGE